MKSPEGPPPITERISHGRIINVADEGSRRVSKDTKIEAFTDRLSSGKTLKNCRLAVFTESREPANIFLKR